jgi:hypothetical protein
VEKITGIGGLCFRARDPGALGGRCEDNPIERWELGGRDET